ncbi:hypothetical protein LTR97_008610 [Elasticomyces elasticus]|uniref:Transmembrane protein n=1 Tax=Elasticomyces elasticus TaxID=574655 RepID=A0AAN7W3Z8_9PEZI|nr:hypothetical protein LTR97_008610 [Elasticomyces elasticus]
MSRVSRHSRDNDYSSDDSTLVNESRYSQRQRPRRRRSSSFSDSADSLPRRRSQQSFPTQERDSGIGKPLLAVGFLAVFAGILHVWSRRKKEEQEREERIYRRERRERFAEAKAKRRAEEGRRERERGMRYSGGDGYDERSEVRRIGFVEGEVEEEGSRVMMIEDGYGERGGDERDHGQDERRSVRDRWYEEDRRSRRGR